MVCSMSFKMNDCQQLSLDDSFISFTERERNALEKSWVKVFANNAIPRFIKKSQPSSPQKAHRTERKVKDA